MRLLAQNQIGLNQLARDLGGQLQHEEVAMLLDSIRNRSIRYRNRAILLLAHLHGLRPAMISEYLCISRSTVYRQIRLASTDGSEKLLNPFANRPRKSMDEAYCNAVFAVLHTPPRAYDFNRTTWRLVDIKSVMATKGFPIAKRYIGEIIKNGGYRYRKAKRVLTSTDPNYKKKLREITGILSRLGPREKFFSIDEFGPFAVKIQGGRALSPKGRTRTVPQRQKSKGELIVTGALELSTNQLNHFYSKRKNTAEMIKLLELVVKKYCNEDRIYISWDAASWHASKALYKRVDELNEEARKKRGPVVRLSPLPSCAQFLNVIESVFSGMARAVIHNSDYESVEECRRAIDRHFAERNRHFRKYPKRAGNKIWGGERVVPKFSESNNCKDSRYSNPRHG